MNWRKLVFEVIKVVLPFLGAWAGVATSGCANLGGVGPNVLGFG